MSLFSAFDLPDDPRSPTPGYRLHRLEWLNWGTFDGDVHHLELNGRNTLLTGDIGSGKSTIVDAVTTLLLRPDRISYNKAAGADVRERTLRSYVQGHWKTERNEATGTSRPVALRGDTAYSVLLAVFANQALDQQVTVAVVLWLSGSREGQPLRFYAVDTRRALGIAEHFTGFGSKVAGLKKRLRADGVAVLDSFADYEKQYRRALGIPSAQAMELLHQTISMKSVGSLNEFVRAHMLEPFDAAARVRALIGHFEDLNAAHDAVVRARLQLERLDPVLAVCDEHADVAARLAALKAEQQALDQVAWHRRRELLQAAQEQAEDNLRTHERRLAEVTEQGAQLQRQEHGVREARAGFADGRLGQLETELGYQHRLRDSRRAAANHLNARLTAAGLPGIEHPDDITARLGQARTELDRVRRAQESGADELATLEADRRGLDQDARAVNDELRSLRGRRSNIPTHLIQLRDRLCTDLGLTTQDVPFIGELIQVRDRERDWQGAAERVLRGFGLSLAVREQHYADISTWINDHHLGTRLVYLRVGARPRPPADPGPVAPDAELLADKLQVADGDLRTWVLTELSHRAGHVCVSSMSQFRRLSRAVTVNGLVKSGDRHEKDDRRRVDDPSNYVLGWSNTQKVDALLAHAGRVKSELDKNHQRIAELRQQRRLDTERRDQLSAIDAVDPDSLNWWAAVRSIAALETEQRQLEESSGELAELSTQLATIQDQRRSNDKTRDQLQQEVGALKGELSRTVREIAHLTDRLAACPEVNPAVQQAVLARLGPVTTPAECVEAADAAGRQLAAQINRTADRKGPLESRAVRLMAAFQADYPVETNELDASIDSAGGYRQLHDRLAEDDLPRFETDFKRALNSETIKEIAGFQAQLRRQLTTIKERVRLINDALRSINYNDQPDTYITLEYRDTPNVDIRDFRRDLAECTSGIVGSEDDDQYSETKFLQVQQLICRFKGRDGFADADRAWMRRVTDVRNWLWFSGCERYRDDDTERETFSDSDGKSGGQKEKLAYTILAAALTYQFKIDPGSADSKTFRFAVIDEAFGRGSDASTRYALNLFARFGLQLLVVTPLQKVQVIEPYVWQVGFAANPHGNRSQLLNMTISEYREGVRRARTPVAAQAL